MKKHVALYGIVSGFLLAVMFNNCSPQHSGETSTDGFSIAGQLSFEPCSFKDEMDLFSKTYQPFLRNNCSSCHVEGGIGKGAFASSGLLVGYNAFTVPGYELVSFNATNDAHKPPYTGPQHTTVIELLKTQWIAGLQNIASCAAGSGGVTLPVVDEGARLETIEKPVNIVADGVISTVSWNFTGDLDDKNGAVTLPNVSGSKLSINVNKVIIGGKAMYEITSPTLQVPAGTGPTPDILIQSLIIKLNGKQFAGQTTFRYVDMGVRQNTTTLLSPGALLVSGIITPTDKISISIGTLQPVALPPPPVLPVVSFEVVNQTTSETISVPAGLPNSSAQNFLDVRVFLDRPFPDGYVTASIGVVTTGVPNNLKAVNRNTNVITDLAFDDRDDVIIDRWDWDYSMDSSAAVFDAGVTVATVRIRISNDQRDELDEKVVLQLRSPVNSTISATNGTFTLTIQDDDAAPNPVVPTFSQLMSKGASDGAGGVLFDYCLRCHNPLDNRGGYNLTDYDLMVNNGVLIPGDSMSMMFRRMNEAIPGLRTMPLEGLLPSAKRRDVEAWILNGAKND